MVFVEFTSTLEHLYFVGATLQDILDRTTQGTEFACWDKFTSYQEVTEADVRKAGVGTVRKNGLPYTFLDKGMQCIREGRDTSYFIGARDRG